MVESKREHLKDLLESFDTAMFITRHGEREHARPMALACVEGVNTIWFITSEASPKSEEIRHDGRVSVTFQSSRRFVALSGHAELVRDRSKIDALWKPSWRVWFPEGKDDPNVVLIKVTVTDAEFWDNTGTRGIRYVFEAAKALLKHTTPTVSDVLHGRVKTSEVEPLSQRP